MLLLGFVGFELIYKRIMSKVVLGNYHNARGAFVKPLHYPRSKFSPNSRKTKTFVKERIYKSTVFYSSPRMHRYSPRLVNHNNVIILIDNWNLYILRLSLQRFRGTKSYTNVPTPA